MTTRDEWVVGPHVLRANEIDPASTWMQDTAAEYRRLMTGFEPPLATLALDGIQILDVGALRAYLEPRLIPLRTESVFDIIRSDFGETLGYTLLEGTFGTEIALKQLRTRERSDLAARGIDVVGVEESAKLRLVIAEIKVSDEAKSPPKAVEEGETCVRSQLASHMARKDETLRKLARIALQCNRIDVRRRIFAAMVYWQEDRWEDLDVVCCAIVVRSRDAYQPTDFGSLRDNQTSLGGATLRFIILLTPRPIEETVRRWYEIVLAGTAS